MQERGDDRSCGVLCQPASSWNNPDSNRSHSSWARWDKSAAGRVSDRKGNLHYNFFHLWDPVLDNSCILFYYHFLIVLLLWRHLKIAFTPHSWCANDASKPKQATSLKRAKRGKTTSKQACISSFILPLFYLRWDPFVHASSVLQIATL